MYVSAIGQTSHLGRMSPAISPPQPRQAVFGCGGWRAGVGGALRGVAGRAAPPALPHPPTAPPLRSAGVPLLLRQMRGLGVKKKGKNDSRSPRTCAGCGATRGLLPQPAGEVSAAPYGAGKINNERGNFSRTAGEARPVSPPLLLSKTKFKKTSRNKRGGER